MMPCEVVDARTSSKISIQIHSNIHNVSRVVAVGIAEFDLLASLATTIPSDADRDQTMLLNFIDETKVYQALKSEHAV